MASSLFKDKNIILGVTGSVACYKACYLASSLTQLGASVYVIMTRSACEFVCPLTFQALTGKFVSVNMFDPGEYSSVEHVHLAEEADLVLIAPASANTIGKCASGIADDMLSATFMATKAPVIIAPTMNSGMYDSPIVQENIHKLETHGVLCVGPEKGYLACGHVGLGRMSEPDTIINKVEDVLKKEKLAH